MVVELFNHPSKFLLLHSNILKAVAPPLGAAIARWSKPTPVEYSSTEPATDIYRLRLELDDGILSLKAKVQLYGFHSIVELC